MFDQSNQPQNSLENNQAPQVPKSPISSADSESEVILQIPKPQAAKLKTTGRVSSAGWLALVLLILVSGSGLGYYVYSRFFSQISFGSNKSIVNQNQSGNSLVENIKNQVSSLIGSPIVLAQDFASYSEPKVEVSPAIVKYQVATDLNNISNLSNFTLSDQAKNLIAKNNFVVMPGYAQEFFSIYESNRYAFVPSFITTDSILHNYHLAFNLLLRTIESNKLKATLTELTYNMLNVSKEQYEQLKGTDWENAAKRNVAFFTVANKLVYPAATPVDYVTAEVNQELDLINLAAEIKPSAVMNIGVTDLEQIYNEDYTQYIARGHYTRTEDLKAYFKSMMYLGRLTFRQKSDEETKSAILITKALQGSTDLKNLWQRIYEPTSFFVGKADDLSFADYNQVLTPIYGTGFNSQELLDGTKFESAKQALQDLPSPKINSIPIFDARFMPDRDKEIKGLRFMGQRYTLDSDIFQRLVYREVGDKSHECDSDPTSWDSNASRRLPSGLDIAAAFGSNHASQIQKDKGEVDYACYQQNLDKMTNYVSGLNGKTWVQNLYWGWLYSLRPLLAEKGEGYPAFMQNAAWQKKDLNTFLGSWTELRHDTILYVKQVYAEMGGGMPDKKDDRGYVEPNPYVYARLAALTKMTKEGLQLRTLISDSDLDLLNRLETLALKLKEISEKELGNQALTDEDYEFIRTYGGSLEHMWLDAYKDLGIESISQLSQEPAAIAADVATDPNGQVLEEGTGRIYEIYAVVPVDGKLRIAKGGVFSHYEFAWPLNDRLTDEKWRSLVDQDKQPAMADWTKAFITK
ncbi:MAG: DUF3160 domain-containing protein [Candidatus Buchananbacteria bacterium]